MPLAVPIPKLTPDAGLGSIGIQHNRIPLTQNRPGERRQPFQQGMQEGRGLGNTASAGQRVAAGIKVVPGEVI